MKAAKPFAVCPKDRCLSVRGVVDKYDKTQNDKSGGAVYAALPFTYPKQNNKRRNHI